eukprot:scaffold8068_cov565-Prasinococcus_capsulatus_cf.AAC.7
MLFVSISSVQWTAFCRTVWLATGSTAFSFRILSCSCTTTCTHRQAPHQPTALMKETSNAAVVAYTDLYSRGGHARDVCYKSVLVVLLNET